MMNSLTDAAHAQSLPKQLLPEMRGILPQGLHQIMAVSMIILTVTLVFAIIVNRKQVKRQTE